MLFFVIFLYILLFPLGAEAFLTVVPSDAGGYTFDISSSSLASGAGSDFQNTVVSNTAAERLYISNTSGIDETWSVYIKKSDNLWDDDLVLSAYVSGEGSGNGTMTTTGEYQEVTDMNAVFFSGTGDRDSITVQFKICGVSIMTIEKENYSTEIVYTLVDTP